METEKKLYQEILTMMEEIRDKYPELTKFLDEMQVPDNEDLTLESLKKYKESLKSLIQKYSK